MGFKCGIIGLPNVGKSTIFNALTQSTIAEAANYPFATIEPNVGRVPVPDKRLEVIAKISKSEKIIPTFMDFVDIAGLVKGASEGEGLGNKFLSHIREVEAIAHVVRCFIDPNITHTLDTIDPLRDVEIIETELLLADLESLNKQKNSISKKVKGGDKDAEKIDKIISKLISKIEKGEQIRNLGYDKQTSLIPQGLGLMSTKPLMYVCNVEENSIKNGNQLSQKIQQKALREGNKIVLVSASFEQQISMLKTNEEKKLLLEGTGIKDPALSRVISNGYELLNLQTFFTSGPKETRAWTVKTNSTASQAAGKIHTDFEKGFIRAETINYNDFVKYNGEKGSKESGKMRPEGKDYKVRDGDIFHFRFNI
jgi:GTP-binding protein YchF